MWVMPSNPGVSYLSALAGIRKSTLVVVMPLIKSEDKASGEGSIWSPACSGPEPQGSAPRVLKAANPSTACSFSVRRATNRSSRFAQRSPVWITTRAHSECAVDHLKRLGTELVSIIEELEGRSSNVAKKAPDQPRTIRKLEVFTPAGRVHQFTHLSLPRRWPRFSTHELM
jgi:hypothetical protein